MINDYSSSIGLDKLFDESLIDTVFADEQGIVDLFYESGSFKNDTLDFGGGIYGITCRSVIQACDGDANELRKLLNLRATNQNKSMCSAIIATCKEELGRNAYLV